jgi:hypothetical protein
MSNLIATKSPNLPIPTNAYERAYFDEFTKQLRLYFAQLDNFTQAINTPASGTTANRPTLLLQIGQFYYDTTLGIPIYWNGTVWKNASGTAV